MASVRAKIAALEEASNTSSLTNDTKNINADTLVFAIMSLSAAAAKKDSATVASIASETAISKGLDKKDDLKIAELQLQGILWNSKKWNDNVQPVQDGEDFTPNNHVIAVIASGVAHGAKGKLLTQQRLGRKETSQTYADLIGMSGYISGMEVQSTHFPSYLWEDA